VIGNRFHLVSGMIQSAGALTFLDPTLSTHTGDARHPRAAVRRACADDGDESPAPSTSRFADIHHANYSEGEVHVESLTRATAVLAVMIASLVVRHDRARRRCPHRLEEGRTVPGAG
jgi:hypothetical protein